MKTVRRIAVACTMIVSLMTVLVCAAGDSNGAQPSPKDQDVALNQSVSINETTSGAAVAEKTGKASGGAADHLLPADEEKRTPRSLTRLRSAKQGKSSRQASGLSGDQDVPWYRTGVGALAIVLALLGAGAWAIRRWMPMARVADSSVLRVVARACLSPKHNLALVRVGRRFVLVGVSGDRVNTLCEVCDPDEAAQLTACCDTSGKPGVGAFDDLLLRETVDYGKTAEPQADEAKLTRADGVRTREPLNDLLRKLRTLKSR